MRQLKCGDRVKIVDAPEDARHVLGQTGSVGELGGTATGDSVYVQFDRGGNSLFGRHQLLKIADDRNSA